MQMITFFQGIMLILIEVLCCKLFYEIFLVKRIFKFRWLGRTIDLFLMLLFFTFLFLLSNNLFLKHIFSFIAFTAIMVIHFKTKILRGIIIVAIYQVFVLGIDYLGLIFISYLYSDVKDAIFDSIIGGTVIALICKMFLFGIIITIRKLFRQSDFLNLLSKSEWFRFLYFPIMTLVALIFLLSITNVAEQAVMNTLLLIGFWLVGANLLVIYLIRDIVVREAKLQDKYIILERNRNQIEMYKKMYNNFNKQRKKTHEYKHQMELIEGFLLDGKIKEAADYVTGITGKLKKDLDSIDTNNIVVNTILNSKYQEAYEKDIVFVLKFNDLSNVLVSDDDIVIILSNLLENAIEACSKVDGEKIMHLKITDNKDFLTIATKNTMKEKTKVINGNFLSSKEYPIEHGIGIENIVDTVKRYGGAYVIKQNDDYFRFTIMIPH